MNTQPNSDSAIIDLDTLVAPVRFEREEAAELSSTPLSAPIRFLRWIELIGLESDYGQFRKSEPTDAWMFVEDQEAKGPVPFNEILHRLREGQSPLDVIHESKAYEAEPKWSELVYKPVWSRPVAALAWTIGFWVMAVSVGFILFRFLLPVGTIRTLGSIAYCLLALGIAYTRSKPHFSSWSARLRSPRTPH
jgi:hypothetical protein